MSLFPTYNRFDLEVKSATGTIVEDTKGKKYLDFTSGIGVCNLGHRHPEVQKAVETQLDEYWHVSNLYKQPIQQEVAKLITENSPGDAVFFCNSGAEANEAAIKLARKTTGKDKILTFQQSFHGRTFATMTATGQEKVRTGFGSLLPTFAYATYNDIDSVKELLDEQTAAVMLEVVQGEGGIRPTDETFVKELAQLCNKKGILLIVDEIQTGIGRTGKRFGFEHYGIEPDIFTLAKGLGNGLPVGAMVAKEQYVDFFGPGTHGSTFGGNPLAMAAAKAVLSTVFAETFLHEVQEKADFLAGQLNKEINPLPFVKEIRQKGLMVGIECKEKVTNIIPQLLEKGLMVLVAGEQVIRLLPPLTVTKDEITIAVEQIKEVIQSYEYVEEAT